MTSPDAPIDLTGLLHEGFAFPGPLRDQLTAAVLDGSKTSTTHLQIEDEREGTTLGEAGDRWVVLDSEEQPVAVLETTEIRTVPLGEVDLAHAVDEGEGYTTVAEWRAGHESFWHSEQFRAGLGEPEFTVNDSMLAVLERFRLIADLRPGAAGAGQ
jgi:uncharacterized protein YhfF